GFVQVRSSAVTVLTQKAIPAEEIKPDLVVQTLQHSLETPAARGENPDVRLKTQQRARAQIAIARKVQGGVSARTLGVPCYAGFTLAPRMNPDSLGGS